VFANVPVREAASSTSNVEGTGAAKPPVGVNVNVPPNVALPPT
jgi:hypothetical protein